MRKFLIGLAGAAALLAGLAGPPARAAEGGHEVPLPNVTWPFQGIFGTYDRASLQRGFQVYKEICSNCHGLYHLYYADLSGLGFSPEEVKAIAAQSQVNDLNDAGEVIQRPARASDKFVRPFPNEKAARSANNGALPPDLSLITKAREGGSAYVYGILTGYKDPPADMKMGDGMNYNVHFPGNQIAMPAPLSDGGVTFSDGTKATVPQMAYDVVAFLTWAGEPTMEVRKQTGVKVFLFLIVATLLAYVVKRRIWADVH